MKDDPIVASVRKIRDELAAAFDYDVHAIFADLRRREAGVGERLVRQSQTQRPERSDADEPPIGSRSATKPDAAAI
jgi:hypothetical protein